MTNAISLGSGLLLLALTAADIFRSLLVPRASSAILRVGPALTMALFPVWQAAANRISRPR